MKVPIKEVSHPGIFSMNEEDTKKWCRARDITLGNIDGALSGSGARDVAYKFVLRARSHGVWVGIEKGELLTNEHFSDEKAHTFKNAFKGMLETGLLEIPGLKTGFWRFTNIFRKHIVCPTKILVGQLQKHELQMSNPV